MKITHIREEQIIILDFFFKFLWPSHLNLLWGSNRKFKITNIFNICNSKRAHFVSTLKLNWFFVVFDEWMKRQVHKLIKIGAKFEHYAYTCIKVIRSEISGRIELIWLKLNCDWNENNTILDWFEINFSCRCLCSQHKSAARFMILCHMKP